MIANANNETTTTPQAVTLDNYTGRALVVAYGLETEAHNSTIEAL